MHQRHQNIYDEHCRALQIFHANQNSDLRIRHDVLIEVNHRNVILNKKAELGAGGFKRNYAIGEGKAIAIRNIDVDSIDGYMTKRWQAAVSEEVIMAKKLSELGLMTLNYEPATIHVQGNRLPVLLMDNFKDMVHSGFQVRDNKNGICFGSNIGSSMIFGSCENIENEQYLRKVLEPIIQDIICLLVNGIQLSSDSVNLVIMDTEKTPPHDRYEPATIFERQQIVRLFFYDFSDKRSPVFPLDAIKLETLHAWAERYLTRTFEALTAAFTTKELKLINKPESRLIPIFYGIKNELVEHIIMQVSLKLSLPRSLPSQQNPRISSLSELCFFALKNTGIMNIPSPISILYNHVLNDGIGDLSHFLDIYQALSNNKDLANHRLISIVTCKNNYAKVSKIIEENHIKNCTVFDEELLKDALKNDAELCQSIAKAEQVISISNSGKLETILKYAPPSIKIKYIGEHDRDTSSTSMGLQDNRSGIKLQPQSRMTLAEFIEVLSKKKVIFMLLYQRQTQALIIQRNLKINIFLYQRTLFRPMDLWIF